MQAKFEVLYEDRFTEDMSEEEFQKAVSEFKAIVRSDDLFASANSETEKIIVCMIQWISLFYLTWAENSNELFWS